MCSIVTKRIAGVVALCVACALLLGAWLFMPMSAHADKSHTCTRDVIQAQVTPDGSLNVADARTYEFEGRYTLSALALDPPDGGEYVVHGVRVVDESGAVTQLVEVPFQPAWRTSGGPASGSYAVDYRDGVIYAFSTTQDASKTFVFYYTYTNAIAQYDDVSVLYWQFIGTQWDVNSNNVQTTLYLPVPEGESVVGGENVYAFGHGVMNGNVSFSDGDSVVFTVPKVKAGDFAEMRVAFPASWTPGVAPAQKLAGEGLPEVLAEERQWQQQTQMRAFLDLLLVIVPLLVSLACLIVAIVLFFRFGKEHKPIFTGDYWRDVPQKGMNPAVIGRLVRWDKPDANDLTAVLMHLSNLGVVSLTSKTYVEERKVLGDREHVTYTLGLNPERRAQLELDRIDEEALKLVFDKIGVDYGSVTLADIERYAKDHAQSFVGSIDFWQGVVSAEVARQDFFEAAGERCKRAFLGVAALLVFVGIGLVLVTENFMPLLGLIPGAVALAIFSRFMPRRSQEAVDIYARCEALKRWFKDFTALDEAVPTDAKVWGELLVYAYLFGVMDKVVADLNTVAPEIWGDDVFLGSMLWYYNPYFALHMGAASASFFGNAFENTVSTAQSVISQAKGGGGGNFGGGGGGFSMGGGGGFGGMGGGFSR